jgi:hypothetical protein
MINLALGNSVDYEEILSCVAVPDSIALYMNSIIDLSQIKCSDIIIIKKI